MRSSIRGYLALATTTFYNLDASFAFGYAHPCHHLNVDGFEKLPILEASNALSKDHLESTDQTFSVYFVSSIACADIQVLG